MGSTKNKPKPVPQKKVQMKIDIVDVKSPFEPAIAMHRREIHAVNSLKDKLIARGSSKVLLGLDKVSFTDDNDFDDNDIRTNLNTETTVHSYEADVRGGLAPSSAGGYNSDDGMETNAPSSAREQMATFNDYNNSYNSNRNVSSGASVGGGSVGSQSTLHSRHQTTSAIEAAKTRTPNIKKDVHLNTDALRKAATHEMLPHGASGRYGSGIHHDDDLHAHSTANEFKDRGHVTFHPDPTDYASQLLYSHGSIMTNSHLTGFDHAHDDTIGMNGVRKIYTSELDSRHETTGRRVGRSVKHMPHIDDDNNNSNVTNGNNDSLYDPDPFKLADISGITAAAAAGLPVKEQLRSAGALGGGLDVKATISDLKGRHDQVAYHGYNPGGDTQAAVIRDGSLGSDHVHKGAVHVSLTMEQKKSILNYKEKGLSKSSYQLLERKKSGGMSAEVRKYNTVLEYEAAKESPSFKGPNTITASSSSPSSPSSPLHLGTSPIQITHGSSSSSSSRQSIVDPRAVHPANEIDSTGLSFAAETAHQLRLDTTMNPPLDHFKNNALQNAANPNAKSEIEKPYRQILSSAGRGMTGGSVDQGKGFHEIRHDLKPQGHVDKSPHLPGLPNINSSPNKIGSMHSMPTTSPSPSTVMSKSPNSTLSLSRSPSPKKYASAADVLQGLTADIDNSTHTQMPHVKEHKPGELGEDDFTYAATAQALADEESDKGLIDTGYSMNPYGSYRRDNNNLMNKLGFKKKSSIELKSAPVHRHSHALHSNISSNDEFAIAMKASDDKKKSGLLGSIGGAFFGAAQNKIEYRAGDKIVRKGTIAFKETNTLVSKIMPTLPKSMNSIESHLHGSNLGAMGESGKEKPLIDADGHYSAKVNPEKEFAHVSAKPWRSFFGGTMVTPYPKGKLTGQLGMPASPWNQKKDDSILKLAEQLKLTDPNLSMKERLESQGGKWEDMADGDHLDAEDHTMNSIIHDDTEDVLHVAHSSWKLSQKPKEEKKTVLGGLGKVFGLKKKERTAADMEDDSWAEFERKKSEQSNVSMNNNSINDGNSVGGNSTSGHDNKSIGSNLSGLPNLTVDINAANNSKDNNTSKNDNNNAMIMTNSEEEVAMTTSAKLDKLFRQAVAPRSPSGANELDEFGIPMVRTYSSLPGGSPTSRGGASFRSNLNDIDEDTNINTMNNGNGNTTAINHVDATFASFATKGATSFAERDMSSTTHHHKAKSGYRGGAGWIEENEAKRAMRSNGGVAGGLTRKASMEYASTIRDVAGEDALDQLPREADPEYFQKKTARDRLRSRLLQRYTQGNGMKKAMDTTLDLRPDHDRLNDGFMKPIDRQAEAIIGVYQSDLNTEWGR